MFLFIRTMFLTGPMNQLKKMFDPSRLVATIVFLVKFIRNNWAKKKENTWFRFVWLWHSYRLLW